MASAKAVHNTVRATGPKDITSYYEDNSLWERLHGTGGYNLYQDLYVGDYFKMSVNGEYGEITSPGSNISGSSYVTLVGIDWLTRVKRDQYGPTIDHHIICIPGKGYDGSFHFGRYKMRQHSSEIENGYVGSFMHTDLIGPIATSYSLGSDKPINQQLYNEFRDHLCIRGEELTDKVNPTGYNRLGLNTGCSSSLTKYNSNSIYDKSTYCQAVILNEFEVYGKTIWASSEFDVGYDPKRLPGFIDNKILTNGRNPWWLRDIVSTAYFPFVFSYNMSYYENATGILGCIRPRFILS